MQAALLARKGELKKTTTVVRSIDGSAFMIEAARDDRLFAIEGIDWLFLGSEDAVLNAAGLRSSGIERVVNVAEGCAVRPADPQISVLHVPLLDDLDQGEALLRELRESIAPFVTRDGGPRPTLVHCQMGVSRSASCVIALLMLLQGASFPDAFDRVRRSKPDISPNPAFRKSLSTFSPAPLF